MNDIWNPLPEELLFATKSTHRFLEWPVKMIGSSFPWQVSKMIPVFGRSVKDTCSVKGLLIKWISFAFEASYRFSWLIAGHHNVRPAQCWIWWREHVCFSLAWPASDTRIRPGTLQGSLATPRFRGHPWCRRDILSSCSRWGLLTPQRQSWCCKDMANSLFDPTGAGRNPVDKPRRCWHHISSSYQTRKGLKCNF